MPRLESFRDFVLRHGTAAATAAALGFLAVLMVVPAAPARNGDPPRTFVWQCHSPGSNTGEAPLALVRAVAGAEPAR